MLSSRAGAALTGRRVRLMVGSTGSDQRSVSTSWECRCSGKHDTEVMSVHPRCQSPHGLPAAQAVGKDGFPFACVYTTAHVADVVTVAAGWAHRRCCCKRGSLVLLQACLPLERTSTHPECACEQCACGTSTKQLSCSCSLMRLHSVR